MAGLYCTLVLLSGCGSHERPKSPLTPRQIDEAVAIVAGRDLVGAEVVVGHNGKVVLDRTFGNASYDPTVKVSAATRFWIGSITKQFTAAAVMRLVDRHMLSLDDTLDQLLPDEPWHRAITVRELLQHTSGLSTEGGYATLGQLAKRPLQSKPGTRWAYNNNGYILLGKIIEAKTGAPLAQALYQEVHGIWPDATRDDVVCHSSKDAVAYIPASHQKAQMQPPSNWGGAGTMCATGAELVRWSAALRSGHVVSKSSWKQMTTPSTPSLAIHRPYGFALYLDHDTVWHDGFYASDDQRAGFTSYLGRTANGDDIAVLLNTLGDGYAQRIARDLLSQMTSTRSSAR